MINGDIGESEMQDLTSKKKGVLAVKRKQKLNAKISESSENEPSLKAQLTTKGLTIQGQGASAIRAVSLIVCLTIIAIIVIAVVIAFVEKVDFPKSIQACGQGIAYFSQSVPNSAASAMA